MMFMVSTPSPDTKGIYKVFQIFSHNRSIIATPLLPWVVENVGTVTTSHCTCMAG